MALKLITRYLMVTSVILFNEEIVQGMELIPEESSKLRSSQKEILKIDDAKAQGHFQKGEKYMLRGPNDLPFYRKDIGEGTKIFLGMTIVGAVGYFILFPFMTPEDKIYPNKAKKYYKKAADEGHPGAQYWLGTYYEGKIVLRHDQKLKQKINYFKAKELHEKSAIQGYSDSQCSLGILYLEGKGVTKNISKANELFEKAAAQGHIQAAYQVGYAAYTSQDYVKSRKWLEISATQGDSASQYYLGLLHRNNLGGPRDDEKAQEWLRKAANQDHLDAKKNLEELNKEIDANKKQQDFQRNLIQARNGDPTAQNQIGCAYYNGDQVGKDVRIAREWFERSAAQGNWLSMTWLGQIYFNSEGGTYEEGPIHVRRAAALMWYRKTADHGWEYAQGWIDRILREAQEGGYLAQIQ